MQLNYILIGALKKFLPFIPSPLMGKVLGWGESNLFSVPSNKWRTMIKT